MTDTRKKTRRSSKARALLLAVGAAAIIAGCDDDTTGTPASDMTTHADMSVTSHPDLALPPTD